MLLKEDNLGLGAKRGKQADNFGLAQLADIYGRLNGKSDVQIKKDQDARQDLASKLYVQQKFGNMSFVRGGLLVGDRIEEDEPYQIKQEPFVKVEEEIKAEPIVKEEDMSDAVPKPSKKEEQREERRRLEANVDETASTIKREDSEGVDEHRHRKEQRREEKKQRRQEKEAKRARKEARRLRRAQKESLSASSSTTAPTPPAEILAPPAVASNPFNVRQRFIKQKRMAMMDPQALREILMQKA